MERAVAWKPPYSEEKREKTRLGLKKTRLGGPKEGLALAKTRLGCQKIPCVSRQNLSQDGGTPTLGQVLTQNTSLAEVCGKVSRLGRVSFVKLDLGGV